MNDAAPKLPPLEPAAFPYDPRAAGASDGAFAMDEALWLMARLRGEGGCPWDRAQTLLTLRSFLLEETYEVLEAMESNDPAKLREELGDLLFQVVFQSRIAEESGHFAFADVAHGIARKLHRRHPHVFGEVKAKDAEGAYRRWEEVKRGERGGRGVASALDGVPRELPALLKARRVQEKAARVGFDWPDAPPVWDKVREETRELEEASASGDARRVEEELGDLLFSVVNLSRFLDASPEDALRRAIDRFATRFRHIERVAAERGKDVKELSLEEMDALWNEAKGL